MLYRLANVIYWLGVIIAVLIIVTIFVIYYLSSIGFLIGETSFATYVAVATSSLIVYGAGWAFRYILTGRTK